MKKNIIFTLSILLILTFSISIISAEDLRSRVREDIKELRDRNKGDIQKVRENFQTAIKEKRASTTLMIREKRESLVHAVQEKREIFKDEVSSIREENIIKIDAKRTELKEKLEAVKDENKKIKMENIANNISDLSLRFTTNSTKTIDKIETVLLTIESRTDKASLSGLNVDTVRALIVSADTAITEARTALTNQMSKTYTISGTDELTIKTSLQSNRDLLKKDIKIVNDKIKAAHESVRKANNALRIIPGINATSTTNIN